MVAGLEEDTGGGRVQKGRSHWLLGYIQGVAHYQYL